MQRYSLAALTPRRCAILVSAPAQLRITGIIDSLLFPINQCFVVGWAMRGCGRGTEALIRKQGQADQFRQVTTGRRRGSDKTRYVPHDAGASAPGHLYAPLPQSPAARLPVGQRHSYANCSICMSGVVPRAACGAQVLQGCGGTRNMAPLPRYAPRARVSGRLCTQHTEPPVCPTRQGRVFLPA